MPRFAYKAYDASGALALGEISAGSRETALEAIQRRGQIPFELNEAVQATSLPWWQRDILGSGRLSTQKLASFTRELASLTKAEIPIDEALRIISVQPMLPQRLRAVTEAALESVQAGQPLSTALAAQGTSFPPYYVSLITAGERSGALGDVLQDLTKFLDRSAATQARVGSALLYPAILLLAAIIALAVIVAVLIPAIQPIFADAGVQPPFMVRALSDLAGFVSAHWITLSALLIASGLVLLAMMQSDAARQIIDHLLLRIPIIKGLIERREAARISRTLSVLTRNGVPILDALNVASGVVSNKTYANALNSAGSQIKEGGTLTAAFAQSAIFPDLFLRLTAVGEKTGQLEAMQSRIAEIYDDALERQVERLLSLITPVLTLVIGGCVGGLILSVMSAIYSVNDLALK